MGGHSSKQTVAATSAVAAKAVQNATQNCVTVTSGGNTIDVSGDGNYVEGVAQTVSFSVDPTCGVLTGQASDFSSSMQDSMSQILKDQQVAMTEWMDTSKDTQATNLNQAVSTSFTQNNVQTCLSSLNGQNVVNVSGDGNYLRRLVQDSSQDVITSCLLKNTQTNQAINDITDTINQKGSYGSENPFAFIPDAIAGVAKSAIVSAVIALVALICFVAIFLALRRRAPPKGAAGPQMAGPGRRSAGRRAVPWPAADSSEQAGEPGEQVWRGKPWPGEQA